MMRRNHEFFCPSALSPGFRNWVEKTRVCVCVCVSAAIIQTASVHVSEEIHYVQFKFALRQHPEFKGI